MNRLLRGVIEALFLLLFFAFLFVLCFRPNWDIDIFWHIKTGEWIVSRLELPRTDIFSATDQTRPWTTFQWLYEVLMYLLEAYLGFTYVRVFHVVVFMGAFALFYRWFRGMGLGRAFAMFMLAFMLTLSQDRLRVRPEVVNFLFAAITLPILVRPAEEQTKKHVIAILAVVAALWANLHAGGALFLPAAALAVCLGRMLRLAADHRDPIARKQARSTFVILGATFLPMLPMPGFIKGSYTAVAMLEESVMLIPEWHPPVAYFMRSVAGPLTAHTVLLGSFPYLMLLALAVIIIAGVLRSNWKDLAKKTDLGLPLLALFYCIFAAKSSRFIYMDALALGVLAIYFSDTLKFSINIRVLLIAIGGISLGITYESSIIRQRHGLSRAIETLAIDNEPGVFPEHAADAMAAMGLKGRIFHLASWGGYLLYRLFPDCTVFADGRGNFNARERMALIETHRPYDRYETLEAAFEEFGFDIVVFPPPVFPLNKWDRNKWFLAYRDDVAEVFIRNNAANSDNLLKALAYWRTMGIDASGDPDVFQNSYLRVLGLRYLERQDVQKRLAEAAARLASGDAFERMLGRLDGGLVLFAAGRYKEAERQFSLVLSLVPKHSTAALYIAWCKFLMNDTRGAADVISKYFLAADEPSKQDFGPLRSGGKKILTLLVRMLGLTFPGSS